MDLILDKLKGLILFTAALLTLGLLAFRSLKRNFDSPGRVVAKLALTGAIAWAWIFHLKPAAAGDGPGAAYATLIAIAAGVVLAFLWTPAILDLVTGPIVEWFAGGWFADDSRPYYALAKGQRKRGQFEAAVEEIDGQLEKFPGDAEGLLLKAEILAEDLRETDTAADLLDELVEAEEENAQLVSGALKALADWRLRLDGDPVRAEAALQRLVGLFPESATATEAARLIKRIPDPARLRANPALREALAPKKRGERMRVTLANRTTQPAAKREAGGKKEGGFDTLPAGEKDRGDE